MSKHINKHINKPLVDKQVDIKPTVEYKKPVVKVKSKAEKIVELLDKGLTPAAVAEKESVSEANLRMLVALYQRDKTKNWV